MKKLLLLLLISIKVMAQEATQDSIIWLHGPERIDKTKTETIRTKGEEVAAHGFSAIAEHVSLISNLPDGYLHTLTLYFNSGLINLSKEEFNVEYRDTNLRLVVYEVGPDGKPGTLLTPTPVYFTVTARHRGALELDVSVLGLKSWPQLFIGMAATDDHSKETVMLKVRENKNAVSFVKAKGSSEWTEYDDGSGYKFDINMKLNIAQE